MEEEALLWLLRAASSFASPSLSPWRYQPWMGIITPKTPETEQEEVVVVVELLLLLLLGVPL